MRRFAAKWVGAIWPPGEPTAMLPVEIGVAARREGQSGSYQLDGVLDLFELGGPREVTGTLRFARRHQLEIDVSSSAIADGVVLRLKADRVGWLPTGALGSLRGQLDLAGRRYQAELRFDWQHDGLALLRSLKFLLVAVD